VKLRAIEIESDVHLLWKYPSMSLSSTVKIATEAPLIASGTLSRRRRDQTAPHPRPARRRRPPRTA